MPEGPSLVILKQEIEKFAHRKVLKVSGYTDEPVKQVQGKIVKEIKTWGKHLLICFNDVTIRIHLMLFGKYLIDERAKVNPKLSLGFTNGELNFYTCSVKIITQSLDEVYDWSADVMSPHWDTKAAKAKLKAHPDMLICDALLSQDIFSGVGNIIKNEVLFITKIHPLNQVSNIPGRRLTALINECSNYAFDFLEWKKKNELKKHWLAHTKTTCPSCNIPLHKEYLGTTKRRTYYCDNCQVLF